MLDYKALILTERKKRGISQAKLGQMLGITQQHVNAIEHCKRKPSLDVLERFCDAFDLEFIIQPKK